jgi:hypothetical protein
MPCISSVSFTFLINWAASPFFISEKGLRQGCSLSPYSYYWWPRDWARKF